VNDTVDWSGMDNKKKRALLVGIDRADGFEDLYGCVRDVYALAPLLQSNEDGTPNFRCQTLTSDKGRVTRDTLLRALDKLFDVGADVALLYFAGHGDRIGRDGALVTSDATTRTPGIAHADVLRMVQDSKVDEIIIILDCCYAGEAGNVPQLGLDNASLKPGVTILAATRRDQTAAETIDDRGAFSLQLCGAVEGGAADVLGKVTVAGIYSYLDESFGVWDGQQPVFKTHLQTLNVLRQCQPAVDLEKLRLITTYFSTADHEYRLDSSYESDPRYPPKCEAHEEIFDTLQRYRAAKLLVPVGEKHMFYAAINNKSCSLTPLGRHYWELARRNEF
jgi:Caspase domain